MTEKELEEYKKANQIETVDVKGNEKVKKVYDSYANWIMIAMMMVIQVAVSVLTAVDGNIRNAFPKTTFEWIVWVALRVITAVVSFMIFNSFIKEGEKRGKQSEQYKTAHNKYMEMFCASISKEIKAVSPNAYLAKERGVKALKLVVSSVLTGVAITEATISTNWTGLIGTIVSLVMMAVWGYLKMLDVQDYFVNEYPIYVAVEEHKLKLEKNKENSDDQNK